MTSRPLVRACLVVAVLVPALATRSSARAQTTTLPAVDVMKVEGALDRPLLAYVNGMLDDAEARGATVVLAVDSAGGIGRGAVALAERIAGMRVPVMRTGPSLVWTKGTSIFSIVNLIETFYVTKLGMAHLN